jgi:hypothetical protein
MSFQEQIGVEFTAEQKTRIKEVFVNKWFFSAVTHI